MANVSCPSTLTSSCTSGNADTSCETPTPVYPCGPETSAQFCQENHCLEVQTSLYGAALMTGLAFTLPACGASAIVYIPGLTQAHVGSYLWSAIYGYYEITAYNSSTQEVTIRNNCTDGNASGGMTIPKCSTFIVTPLPLNVNADIAYLAADFVTPALGLCTTITVTDTADLLPGNIITIGAGTYTISSIPTETSLVICNQGLGETPGSTVTALSPSGGYNYPIVLESNSSVLTDEDQLLVQTLDSVSTSLDVTASLTYTNPSSTKNAQIFYTANFYFTGDSLNANTNPISFNVDIQKSIDATPFTSVNEQSDSQSDASNLAHAISKEINYDGVETVGPLATKTIDVKGILTWLGTSTAEIEVGVISITANAIVVF